MQMNKIIIDGRDLLNIAVTDGDLFKDKVSTFRDLGYSIVVAIPAPELSMEAAEFFGFLVGLEKEGDKFEHLCVVGASEWGGYLYLDDKAVSPSEFQEFSVPEILALVNHK